MSGLATVELVQPAARRAHGAAVARRLMAGPASGLAATLDWDTLVQAPAWLGWDEHELALLARRAGALLAWPAPGLWIDAARLAAARAAVGANWWRLLLRHDARPLVTHSAGPGEHPSEHPSEHPGEHPGAYQGAQSSLWTQSARLAAGEVATAFQAAGTTLLLASLPHGALRHGVQLMLQAWLDAAGAALQAPGLAGLGQPLAMQVLGLGQRLQHELAGADADDEVEAAPDAARAGPRLIDGPGAAGIGVGSGVGGAGGVA